MHRQQLFCIFVFLMAFGASCDMNIEWYFNHHNITQQLNRFCFDYPYHSMKLIVLHEINNFTLSNHLDDRHCDYIELDLDCESCIAEVLGDIYPWHDKIILIEHLRFEAHHLDELVRMVKLVNTKCVYRCRLIAFLDGPGYSLPERQEMVHNSLSDANIRMVVVHVSHIDKTLQAQDVVYIRPILNGCISYEGIMKPKSVEEINSLKTIASHCNLNGSTLRIAVNDVSSVPGMLIHSS